MQLDSIFNNDVRVDTYYTTLLSIKMFVLHVTIVIKVRKPRDDTCRGAVRYFYSLLEDWEKNKSTLKNIIIYMMVDFLEGWLVTMFSYKNR
ncbi:hypothetical protein Misp06_00487 [Microbulbifer sp. NBRC 101763]